jgi:hypothetical protein
MNIQEGARRMRRAGAWLAIISACGGALVFGTQLSALFGPGEITAGGIAIVGGLIFGEILMAAAPGVLLWIAAWIVEGFVKEKD